MVEQRIVQDNEALAVLIDDVNRVLELGRILLSALTQEELDQLRNLLENDPMGEEKVTLVSLDEEASYSYHP